MNLNEMINVDLPSLQSIQLGFGAWCGKDSDPSPKTMQSIINMMCKI